MLSGSGHGGRACVSLPWRLRSASNFIQSRSGHPAEWEDVFVAVYGLRWRELRDSCDTLVEWKKNFSFFDDSVRTKWDLPVLPKGPNPAPQQPPCGKRQCQRRDLRSCPSKHDEDGAGTVELDWGSRCKQFAFIVDCQPLQRVAAGLSPLLDSSLEQVIHGICNNLVAILDRGWTPPRLWHDPFLWYRRRHNVIAEHLVNYTIDEGRTWSKALEWPFPGMSITDCNLVAHSDGGTRAGRCSGLAWIVEAGCRADDGWTFLPIAMGGTYVSTPILSFSAEALALQECTLFVQRLLSHKRAR